MKITVFTASIGNTDRVKDPTLVDPEVRYVAFVDKPLESKIWRSVIVKPEANTTRQARRLKILAHETLPGVDWSLWIDAAYRLDVSPLNIGLLANLRGNEAAALEHPDRTNIFDEGAVIVQRNLAPKEKIAAQIEQYRPRMFGQSRLTTTGLLLRSHDKKTIDFNERWWSLFSQADHNRDQMSVDMAATCTDGFSIEYLPGHYRDNKFAKWFSHKAGA